MKIGDLVLYTRDGFEVDPHDRLGVIMSFDEQHGIERTWVHWFESGEEQWAAPDWMEVVSEVR